MHIGLQIFSFAAQTAETISPFAPPRGDLHEFQLQFIIQMVLVFAVVSLIMFVTTFKNAIPKRLPILQDDDGELIVRPHRGIILRDALLNIIGLAFIFFFSSFLEHAFERTLVNLLALALLGPIAVWKIFAAIDSLFRKCVINGDEVIVTSIFSNKSFSFKDITEVRVKHLEYISTKTSLVERITMFSYSDKVFVARPRYIGYDLLVKRLENAMIPGIEELQETENPVPRGASSTDIYQQQVLSKMGIKGFLLLVLPAVMALPAVFPAFLPYEFPPRQFAYAYSALEILEAYQAWYENLYLGLVWGFIVVILGNLVLFIILKFKGKLTRPHLLMAVIALAIVGYIGVDELNYDSVPALVQAVREDIAAIESGELVQVSGTVRTSANTPVRLRSPGTEPTRMMWQPVLQENGRWFVVHLPLGVELYGDVELWVTPYFHLVVEVS